MSEEESAAAYTFKRVGNDWKTWDVYHQGELKATVTAAEARAAMVGSVHPAVLIAAALQREHEANHPSGLFRYEVVMKKKGKATTKAKSEVVPSIMREKLTDQLGRLAAIIFMVDLPPDQLEALQASEQGRATSEQRQIAQAISGRRLWDFMAAADIFWPREVWLPIFLEDHPQTQIQLAEVAGK